MDYGICHRADSVKVSNFVALVERYHHKVRSMLITRIRPSIWVSCVSLRSEHSLILFLRYPQWS
jgi:hypothetical protein